MIVLSDGAPAGSNTAAGTCKVLGAHLKKVVLDLGKQGIDLFGIGIQSHEVEKFYPDYVVLHDISQLAVTPLKKLEEFLLSRENK